MLFRSAKNPQANYAERAHQALGSMARAYELGAEHEFDCGDPWPGILASCAWAIRSTAHTVMDATPAQLIFGRDMLFDLSFKSKWRDIRKKRIDAIKNNTVRENSKRVQYKYKIGDKVLLENSLDVQRKLYSRRKGPYNVVRVYPSGVLKIQKGFYTQRVSIRRCTPYKSPNT